MTTLFLQYKFVGIHGIKQIDIVLTMNAKPPGIELAILLWHLEYNIPVDAEIERHILF